MKWLYGICIVLFPACQQEEKPKYTKLTGHWHVFQREDSGKNCYEIIDFKNSTIFYEGGIEAEWYKGYADFPNQKLDFSPITGRLSKSFKYEFAGDSLLLKRIEPSDNKVLAYDYYAIKVNEKLCTFYEHDFRCSGLNSELTKIDKKEEFEELSPFGLQAIIQTGYSKSLDSSEILIQEGTEQSIIKEIDIPLFLEKHRIVISEEQKNKIQLAFYADKKTKIKHLKPILQKLAEITDRPKVVLVFQYNPQPDDFELFGKEIIFEGVDWQEVEDEMFFVDYVLGQN